MGSEPLLALLQHTGAATPLLDVTTDPMVALFFATEPNGQPGLLVALNVHESKTHYFDVGTDIGWRSALDKLDAEGKSLGLYTPPTVTTRIMAQRGRFVFGRYTPDLSFSTLPVAPAPDWTSKDLQTLFGETGGGWVGKRIPPAFGIVIRSEWKGLVREVLTNTYGLSPETLFPDLAGFASANGMRGPVLASSAADSRTLF